MTTVAVERACQGCGGALPPQKPGRRRKWCSEQCRRDTLYGGTCEWCGGRTNGSDGPGTAAVVCSRCLQWTPEQIIDAIQRWAAEHGGIPPTATEWRNTGPGHPSSTCVINRLGWNEALLQAGFGLRVDRRPETQEWIEKQLRAGRSTEEIADALGVTPSAIYMRMRWRGVRVSDIRGDTERTARRIAERRTRVRDLRAQGLTQTEIAARLGVSQFTISRDVRSLQS